jgi:hypothetical protein
MGLDARRLRVLDIRRLQHVRDELTSTASTASLAVHRREQHTSLAQRVIGHIRNGNVHVGDHEELSSRPRVEFPQLAFEAAHFCGR